MPIFIDSDTGFPSEVPCPGCGWPLYCCLCKDEDLETEEGAEQHVVSDSAEPRPNSVVCGNCDASRMVDDQWEVEDCPNCKDDGYNILLVQDQVVP